MGDYKCTFESDLDSEFMCAFSLHENVNENLITVADDENGNVAIDSSAFRAFDEGNGNIIFIPITMFVESDTEGNVVLV